MYWAICVSWAALHRADSMSTETAGVPFATIFSTAMMPWWHAASSASGHLPCPTSCTTPIRQFPTPGRFTWTISNVRVQRRDSPTAQAVPGVSITAVSLRLSSSSVQLGRRRHRRCHRCHRRRRRDRCRLRVRRRHSRHRHHRHHRHHRRSSKPPAAPTASRMGACGAIMGRAHLAARLAARLAPPNNLLPTS